LGGAVGYFDKNDIFAFAPPESGKIAPAQIKNSSGHLIEGFTFKTGTITRKSEESSVGYVRLRMVGQLEYILTTHQVYILFSKRTRDFSVRFETIPQSAAKGDPVIVSACN